MAEGLGKFENKARLLSDDEQELIGVLTSMYEAIQELRNRQSALEAVVNSFIGVQGRLTSDDG